MSSSIDERIVSMKFDNKQFEKGAKESINTIERLKKSMNFDKSVKNVEQLQQATSTFNTGNVEKSIANIEKRFSTLGVVGMTAIQNITNSALSMAKTIGRDLMKPITGAISQIKSGGLNRAFNLEQANFQLMGLLNNAKKVEQIIGAGGPVQEAVAGTAFGLDQAAVAASQLVASGMKTSELLIPLQAISGVASMTGRQYSDIAEIFTTVKSNGKLMTMQLRQLSASGLNASAALAKSLGKTEAEINQMVTNGEISFEQFSNAMYEAFGQNAKRANDTFNGALANMKAALSRIGADVATPAIKDFRDLFNSLRPVIDEIHTALSPALESITSIITQVTSFNISLTKNKEVLTGVSYAIGLINSGFEFLRDMVDPVINVIKGIINIFTPLVQVLQAAYAAFKDIFPKNLAGVILGITEKFKNFTESLKISNENVEKLRAFFRGLWSVVAYVIELITALKNVIFEVIKTFSPLGNVVFSIAGFIGTLITNIVYYFRIVLAIISYTISYFGGIQTVIQGIVGIIAIAVGKIFDVLSVLLTPLNGVLDNILKFFNVTITEGMNFGEVIEAVFVGIKDKIVSIFPVFISAGEKIGSAFKSIYDFITGLFSGSGSATAKAAEKTNVFNKASEGVESNAKKIEASFSAFDILKSVVEKVSAAMKGAMELLGNVFSAFNKGAEKLAPVVRSLLMLGSIIAIAAGLIKTIKVIKAFCDVVMQSAKVFESLLSSIKKFTRGLAGIVTQVEKLIKEYNKKLKTDRILKIVKTIAASILILVGSIVILSLIPVENLKKAIITIASALGVILLFAGALVGISALLKKFDFSETLYKTALSMLMLSVSVGVLGIALKSLDDVNTDGLLVKAGAISMMTAVLGLVAIRMSQITVSKFMEGSLGLIAFAGSIYIVVQSLKSIAESDVGKIYASMPILVGIIGGLTAVALTMKSMKFTSSIAFLSIALGIRILIPVLMDIVESFNSFDFMPFVTAFLSTLTAIIIIAKSMDIAAKEIMKHLKEFAKGMLFLSVSVMILMTTIKMFTGIKLEEISSGIVALGAVMGLIAVFMLISKYVYGKEIAKFGAGMILLTASIVALSVLVRLIGEINPDVLMNGIKNVFRIEMLIVVLMVVARLVGGSKGIMKMGIGVGILAASIFALSGVVIALGYLDQEKILFGVKAVGALITLLSIFAIVVGLIDPKNMDTIGKGALFFSAAIAALGICVIALGYLDPTKILVGTVAVGALVALMTYMTKTIGNIEMDNIKGPLTSVLLSIGILMAITTALVILANQDMVKVITATISMLGIMVVLEKVFEKISEIKLEKEQLYSIISFAGMLVVLAASLALASANDWSSILVAAGAIISVLLVYNKIFEHIVETTKNVKPMQLLSFAAGSLALITIGIALKTAATGTDWSSVLAAGYSISMVLIVYATIFKNISLIASNLKSAATIVLFLVAAGVLEKIAVCLNGLAMYNWSSLLGAAVSISAVLIAYGLVFKLMSTIDPKAALYGAIAIVAAFASLAVAFVTVIFIVGEVLVAIGTLNEYVVDLESLIKSGGDVLAAIGEAIGGFFGSIAKGFSDAISAALPNLGEGLGGFAENAKPFFSMLKGINKKTIVSAAAMAGVVAVLAAASFINAIQKVIDFFVGTNSFDDMTDDLLSFADTMKKFQDKSKGLKADRILVVSEAAKNLAIVAGALPKTGGVFQAFTGTTDWKGVGDGAVSLATALGRLSDQVKLEPINAGAISQVKIGGLALAQLSKEIPNANGVVQWFTGTTGWREMGEGAVSLATSLGLLSKQVGISPINSEAIQQLKKGGVELSKLSEEIPNSGGVVSWFTGTTGWREMGEGAVSLTTALGDISKQIAKEPIETTAIQQVKDATLILSEIEKEIPSTGNVIANWFTGTTDWSGFSDGIKELAKGIAGFVNELRNEQFNGSMANTAANVGLTLAKLYEILPDNWDNSKFNSMKSSVPELGSVLTSFSNSMHNVSLDDIEKVESVVNLITSAFNKIESSSIDNLKNFSSSINELTSAFKLFKGKETKLDTKSIDDFTESVKKLANSFKKVFKDTKFKELKTFTNIFLKLSKSIEIATSIDTAKIDPFNENLKKLTDGLNTIKKSTKTLKQKDLTKLTKEIKMVMSSFETKEKKTKNFGSLEKFSTIIKPIYKLVEKNKEIESLSTNIKTLGDNLALFSQTIQGITEEEVVYIGKILSSFNTQLKKVKKIDTKSINKLSESIKKLTDICKTSLDGTNKVLEKKIPIFNKIGTNIIDAIKSGVKDKEANSKLTIALKELVDRIKLTINGKKSEQDKIGKNFIQGFINGLRDNKKLKGVSEAAYKIGDEAKKSLKKSLKQKSPSKETYKSGQYAVLGFINGLSNNIDVVKQSGRSMGEAFLESFNGYMGIHSPATEMINSAYNTAKGWIQGCKDQASKIFNSGSTFGGGFMSGLKDAIGKVKKGNISDIFTGNIFDKFKSSFNADKLSDIFKMDDSVMNKGLGKTTTKQADALKKKEDKKSKAKSKVKARQEAKKDKDNWRKELKKWSAENKALTISTLVNIAGTSIASYTKAQIKQFKKHFKITGAEYKRGLQGYYNYIGQFNKKTQEIMLENPKAIAKYMNNFKSVNTYAKGVINATKNIFGDAISELKSESSDKTKKLQDKIKGLEKSSKQAEEVLTNKKSTKKQREMSKKQLEYNKKEILKANKELEKIQSKTSAKNIVQSFAEGLYKSTDSYKNATKTIKTESNKISKLQDKAAKKTNKLEKAQKKLDAALSNKKTTKKQADNLKKKVENYSKSINDINSKIDSSRDKIADATKEIAKGPEEALKEYIKGLKEGVLSFFDSVKNLDVGSAVNISGIDKIEKATSLVEEDTQKYDILGSVIAGAAQKFDILSDAVTDTTEKFSVFASVSTDTANGLNPYSSSFDKLAKYTSKFEKAYSSLYLSQKKISTIDWSNSGIDMFSVYTKDATKTTDTAKQSVDMFSVTLDTLEDSAESTAESVKTYEEAFDIFNDTIDTGIDLFERFTKTGTMSKNSIFESLRSQLDGYKEFKDGIDKLKLTNLSDEIISSLVEEGLSSMNKVRGFLQMTSDEIDKYNKLLDTKREYENDKLSDSIDDQVAQYEKFQKNLEILKTKSEGENAIISEEFYNSFLSSGMDKADLLERILGDENLLRKMSKSYGTAIYESMTKSIKEEAKAEDEKVTTYIQALRKSFTEEKTFLENTKQLREKLIDLNMDETSVNAFVDKFEEMGYDSANALVTSLLNETDKNLLSGFKDILDDTSGSIIDAFNKLYPEELPKTYLETLRDEMNKFTNVEFEEKLEKLTDVGLNQNAIDKFRELGAESASAMVDSLLKETDDGIKEYNELYSKFNPEIDWLTVLKQQRDNISKYESDLDTLSYFGLSNKGIKKLKEMGYESGESYVNSIYAGIKDLSDGSRIKYFKDLNDILESTEPDYMKAMEEQEEAYYKYQSMLNDMYEAGFSSDIIDKMKEMGQDEAMSWGEGLLKAAKENSDNVTKANALYLSSIEKFDSWKALKEANNKRDEYEKVMEDLKNVQDLSPELLAAIQSMSEEDAKKWAHSIVNTYKKYGYDNAEWKNMVQNLNEQYTKSLSKISILDQMKSINVKYSLADDLKKQLFGDGGRGLNEGFKEYIDGLDIDEQITYLNTLLSETYDESLELQKKKVDEINKEYEKSINKGRTPVQVLIDNYQSQIDELTSYREKMAAVQKLGFNVSEIKEMGLAEGLEWLDAILNASSEERSKLLETIEKRDNAQRIKYEQDLIDQAEEKTIQMNKYIEQFEWLAKNQEVLGISQKWFENIAELAKSDIESASDQTNKIYQFARDNVAGLRTYMDTYYNTTEKYASDVANKITSIVASVVGKVTDAYDNALEVLNTSRDSLDKFFEQGVMTRDDYLKWGSSFNATLDYLGIDNISKLTINTETIADALIASTSGHEVTVKIAKIFDTYRNTLIDYNNRSSKELKDFFEKNNIVDMLYYNARNGEIRLKKVSKVYGDVGDQVASIINLGLQKGFNNTESFLNFIINYLSNLSSDNPEVNSALTRAYKDIYETVNEAATNGVSLTKGEINSIYSKYIGTVYGYGNKISSAIVNGIYYGTTKEGREALQEAGEITSRYISNAVRKGLGINSPSKVFMQIGEYCIQGLTNGLKDSDAITTAYDLVQDLTEVLSGVSEYTIDPIDTNTDWDGFLNSMNSYVKLINDGVLEQIDTNPVITPILDLSDVYNKAQGIKSMFDDLTASANVTADEQNQNGSTIINYEQNNYSPKALNRFEIYRATNNQLSRLREGVIV